MKQANAPKDYDGVSYEPIDYDGVKYEPIKNSQAVRFYADWRKSLTKEEKKAIRRYRRKNCQSTNINARLREGDIPNDAKVISNALSKSSTPINLLVYRRLAKHEAMFLSGKAINELYNVNDFKGTHIGIKIHNISMKGSYLFILVPRGTKAAYINNISLLYRHEREFLIDKEMKYRLIGKTEFEGHPCYIALLVK